MSTIVEQHDYLHLVTERMSELGNKQSDKRTIKSISRKVLDEFSISQPQLIRKSVLKFLLHVEAQ